MQSNEEIPAPRVPFSTGNALNGGSPLASDGDEALELSRRFAESMQTSVGLATLLNAVAARPNLRLEALLGPLHEKLDRLGVAQTPPLVSLLSQTLQRQETLIQNVDQLRLLTEPLIGKLEQLTGDFVNRHVSEPLFKELGRLCWTLRALAGDQTIDLREEVKAQADALERLLDLNDLHLIQPQAGDAFDPHQHQPVLRRPTEDATLHCHIARTIQPGLYCAERIVQHARVEVFVCSTP